MYWKCQYSLVNSFDILTYGPWLASALCGALSPIRLGIFPCGEFDFPHPKPDSLSIPVNPSDNTPARVSDTSFYACIDKDFSEFKVMDSRVEENAEEGAYFSTSGQVSSTTAGAHTKQPAPV